MEPSRPAAPAADLTAAPPADRVLRAEWVLTVDGDDRVLHDGAVALAGERIAAVGDAAEVLAAHPTAEVVDLGGHVLAPGFVNAHTHLSMVMFRGLADDRNLGDFLSLLIPAETRLIDAEVVDVGTSAAAVESLGGGVTTALDMYYFPDSVIDAADRVGLRVMTGPVILDDEGPDHLPRAARMEAAEDFLRRRPARPGWRPVVSPHSTYLVSTGLLQLVRGLAAEHDAAVHIHAAETLQELADVQELTGRRPVELLAHLDLLCDRTVLAHAVHLSDDELERVAHSGATVAHNPASNLKLASGVARVPELLAAGANVALGTDGAASSNDLDMFVAMRLAALLHKGVTGDPTAVPARQALRMATMGGARAVALDDDLGSIEVGKLADLVAVDLSGAHLQPVFDPVSALVYAAGRGDVAHVWVGGEQVVTDSRPTRVDPSAVVDALRELREPVRRAAGISPA